MNGTTLELSLLNDGEATQTVDLSSLGGGSGTSYIPIIQVGLNNNQDITSDTYTALDFNTEGVKDSEFTHSTSTNPSRITVNETGRYRISGFISIEGTTANYRYTGEIVVRVNGSTLSSRSITSGYIRANTGSNESALNVYDVLDLTSGDYVEVLVRRISSTVGDGVTTSNSTVVIVERLDGILGEQGPAGPAIITRC